MAYHENYLEYADGIKIRYRINSHEHEKNIIFIHGFNESLEDYEFLFSYFDYNEIAFNTIELRGHGKSGNIKDVNFNNYLKDLKRFAFGNLKNRPVYLIGHDCGALNVIGLALDKRFSVKGLILVSPLLNIRLSKIKKYFIHWASYLFPDLKYRFKQQKSDQNNQLSGNDLLINKYSIIKKINIQTNKLIRNIERINDIPMLLFLKKNCNILNNDLTIKQLQTIYDKTKLFKTVWYNDDEHLFKSKDKIEFLEMITAWIKQFDN